MPEKTRLKLPPLWGGVSRQPAEGRHLNQVEEASNVVLRVLDGFQKRAGSWFGWAITGLAASAPYRIHKIVRDGETGERYLVIYGDSTYRVFDLDGNEATVNFSTEAQTYLDANDASPVDMRLVTIADYTLLANTTVTLATQVSAGYDLAGSTRSYDTLLSLSPDASPSYYYARNDTSIAPAGNWKYELPAAAGTFPYHTEGLTSGWWNVTTATWLQDAVNPCALMVGYTSAHDEQTAVAYTAATQKLSGAGKFTNIVGGLSAGDKIVIGTLPYSGEYEIDTAAANNTDNLYLIDPVINQNTGAHANIGASLKTWGVGRAYAASFNFQQSNPTDTDDLAQEMQRALQAAGARNAVVYAEATAFTWGGIHRGAGTGCTGALPYRGPDYAEYDLGTSIFTSTKTNQEGSGTFADEDDVVDPFDRWQRVAAPNQSGAQPDPTTLPIQIVRASLSPLEFDADLIDWKPRYSGDNDTNPAPSLFTEGRALADISSHRNRLVLAGDDNIVFSQANDYFNLYLDNATNIVDSDPIDAPLSSEQVALVDYVVSFRKSLAIFTKSGQQFELNAPEVLTPSTAAITPSTSYDSLPLRPRPAGNRLYFPASLLDGVHLFEYYYSDSETSNTAADVSAHTPGYLPADVQSIDVSPNNETVVVVPTGGSSLYVYRYFWSGPRKDQSAWFSYDMDDGYRVVDAVIIDNEIYMLVEYNGSYAVERLPVSVDMPTANWPYRVCLDRKHIITGSYSAGNDETTWTLPSADPGVDAIVLGPDFGASAGQILTPDDVSGTDVTISGDYSAGDVCIGRNFLGQVTLSEQSHRDRNGEADLDGMLLLRKMIVRHTDAGDYQVRVSSENRDDLVSVFSAPDGTLESRGKLELRPSLEADQATITIEMPTARPATIGRIQFIGDYVPEES